MMGRREDDNNTSFLPQFDAQYTSISLDDLAVFVAVGRTQSFTAAAEQIGQDRSRVSRIISRLEAQLGVALFTRTTRVVRLTHEGAALLERARPAVDGLREAIRGAGEQSKIAAGEVVLTTTHELGQHLIAPLVPALRRALPAITLRIETTEQIVDVISDEIDIALRTGSPGAATLITRTLCLLDVGFFASPDYLAAHGQPADVHALTDHERLWPQPPRGTTSFSATTTTTPSVTASFGVLLEIARAGGGVALLPRFMAQAKVDSGELREVLAGSPVVFSAPLYLITRPERPQPERVRRVCDWLVRHLAHKPPQGTT
jgi:DNA-binding transcriptional LysR family regulator